MLSEHNISATVAAIKTASYLPLNTFFDLLEYLNDTSDSVKISRANNRMIAAIHYNENSLAAGTLSAGVLAWFRYTQQTCVPGST